MDSSWDGEQTSVMPSGLTYGSWISGYVFPYFSCAHISEILQIDVTVAGVVLGDVQFRIRDHDNGTFKVVGSCSASIQYIEVIPGECVGSLN